jgi:hypothetical protein
VGAYLTQHGKMHTRGAPYHPMTQGKQQRVEQDRCEGRKPYGTRPGESDGLALIRQLRGKGRKAKASFAAIARASRWSSTASERGGAAGYGCLDADAHAGYECQGDRNSPAALG